MNGVEALREHLEFAKVTGIDRFLLDECLARNNCRDVFGLYKKNVRR